MVVFKYAILLFIFLSCQRNSAPQFESSDVTIDSTLQLFSQEIPLEVKNDIHHLLKMAFQNSGILYDSIQATVYFDPELRDSIYIHSNGTKNFNFIIGNPNNANIAFYTLLDIFGFRFYGPEDHWTYIPHLSNYSPIDTTLVSFFSLRKLIPTYGASRHGIPATDTSGFLFARWMNRLRMANLYKIDAGHYGTTFNIKYRDEISENPEWRGTNANGEVKDWSHTLKLCYSNPGVISLYKKDAAIRLRNQLKNSTPPYFITMDPPDGGGFCQCPNCDSPSNQVYNLANEVAKHLYTIDTNSYVTLYGYNQHAEIPEFQLEHNIVVGIVPNAFQTVGSPEKMMSQWHQKDVMLYLRDYLAIPVWQYDKPSYRPYGKFMQQIDTIKVNNYLGYHYETTASFMSVGLKFYLLSMASWVDVDSEKEYETFLHRMFPGIESEVSLIYENLPELNIYTYKNALQTIRSLIDTLKDNDQNTMLARLKDLEFYVEYLYILNRYEGNKSDENLNVLLDKILSLEGSRLLHTYGLYRTLKDKRGFNRKLERTENISVYIEKENKIQFELRRRTSTNYEAMHPEFYLSSVDSFIPIPLRNENAIVYIGGSHEGKLLFNARLKPLNKNASGSIVFRDLNNNYITEIILEPNNKTKKVELQLEPHQFYKISFRTPRSEIYFQGPNRPFVFTTRLKPKYTFHPISYFFRVPDELDKAIVNIPAKSNEVFVKNDSEILYRKNLSDSYNLEIEDSQGEIIEVQMYRNGLSLLNMPQLLALHKKGIIYKKSTHQ